MKNSAYLAHDNTMTGAIIIPILQMGKRKPREVKLLAQGSGDKYEPRKFGSRV